MKQWCYLIVLLVGCYIQLAAGNQIDKEIFTNNATDSQRTGRFMSLFSVVRFANSFCYGSNGLNGTCYTSAECSSLGGVASGSCASGFGVCCTICITTCGKTATVNNTYWGNPGYPSSFNTPGQCNLNVQKLNSNICQLRLDFINFDINGPTQTGDAYKTQCQVDLFTVSGQTNNVPGICGLNTNQHMYIDMTPGDSQFTLNMLLGTASTGTTSSRTWKIRIAQIPCGTSYTAPDNCLQWFTTSVGTFRSFNYQFSSTPAVQHLANQDYTICIRMSQGFCGICYQVCDVPTSPAASGFSISAVATAVDACLTDWIQIPCATDHQSTTALQSTGAPCATKLCGTFFNSLLTPTSPAPVYSYRKPFEVRVYTNSDEASTDGNIGFCLKYQQLSCTSG